MACISSSACYVFTPVQPANIFLDASLNAKLGDIGLAAMDTRYGLQPGVVQMTQPR
jgi:hypothetical protein